MGFIRLFCKKLEGSDGDFFFLGVADLGPGGKGKRSFREREIFFFQ